MIQLSELLTKKFPPESYLVDSGLLRSNSLMVIGGPPKVHKSFLLTTMLLQMAAGLPLLDVTRKGKHGETAPAFATSQPCRVLYFEQEVGEMDMQSRIQTMLSPYTTTQQTLISNNFYLHSTDHGVRLDSTDGLKRMDEMISKVKPHIVGIDPLKEFHAADENSAKEMSAVIRPFLLMKEHHGFAGAITHHTSKPSMVKKDGPDLLRGSSYLYGVGDTFMMLSRPDRRNDWLVKVDTTLRRARPIDDYKLVLNQQTLNMTFAGWCADPR